MNRENARYRRHRIARISRIAALSRSSRTLFCAPHASGGGVRHARTRRHRMRRSRCIIISNNAHSLASRAYRAIFCISSRMARAARILHLIMARTSISAHAYLPRARALAPLARTHSFCTRDIAHGYHQYRGNGSSRAHINNTYLTLSYAHITRIIVRISHIVCAVRAISRARFPHSYRASSSRNSCIAASLIARYINARLFAYLCAWAWPYVQIAFAATSFRHRRFATSSCNDVFDMACNRKRSSTNVAYQAVIVCVSMSSSQYVVVIL